MFWMILSMSILSCASHLPRCVIAIAIKLNKPPSDSPSSVHLVLLYKFMIDLLSTFEKKLTSSAASSAGRGLDVAFKCLLIDVGFRLVFLLIITSKAEDNLNAKTEQ